MSVSLVNNPQGLICNEGKSCYAHKELLLVTLILFRFISFHSDKIVRLYKNILS